MIRPQPKPVPHPKKARKPLQRSRMKRRLPRRVTRPGPGSDPAYLERVRGLACYAWRISTPAVRRECECAGDVVAHHAGPKTNDRTAVPLCWKHHDEWHDLNGNGMFAGWVKEERRGFAADAISDTRSRLDAVAAPRGGR